MSRFHKGHWYGSAGMVCKRCGNTVYQSDNAEYSYQCFHCDEDLYSFEVAEQDRKNRLKLLQHAI